MRNREKCCENCALGRVFKPRPDEIERYGPSVMECRRIGWEGYTLREDACEVFRPN